MQNYEQKTKIKLNIYYVKIIFWHTFSNFTTQKKGQKHTKYTHKKKRVKVSKNFLLNEKGWNENPNALHEVYSTKKFTRALSVLKKVTHNPSTSSAADTQCKRPSPLKITLAVWNASLQSDMPISTSSSA